MYLSIRVQMEMAYYMYYQQFYRIFQISKENVEFDNRYFHSIELLEIPCINTRFKYLIHKMYFHVGGKQFVLSTR